MSSTALMAYSRQTTGYDLCDKTAVFSFQIASRLTDPICKTHELYRRIEIVDALHPTEGILNLIRKAALCVGLGGWTMGAMLTTLPGVGFRFLGSYLQKSPFIECHEAGRDKTLPAQRSFTLLSWNVCCVAGGYSITDGGVVPWSFRIERIVDAIIRKDADVTCLYETFDLESALYIAEKLRQNGYLHTYLNIGPRAVGVSAGVLVASKYDVKNPEFSPFPQDTLVGRTKYAEKGVFAFDLESSGEIFARIFATHLQHSEEPQFPIFDEVVARSKQMELIAQKVEKVKGPCIVVTGDLNLDDEEYELSSWQERFQKATFEGKTWRGDAFCANMVGKKVSGPLNLDYTMFVKGTAAAISTSLVETGYDAAIFKEEALSDHEGLLSVITLNRSIL